MKPSLTIIIPCYNCQETLREAVDSCFIQGLVNFEIVMVDDASTDCTQEVMHELGNKYEEVKLFFHEKNKGGGATRNTAVKHSTADVIFCLDSDDLLSENTLSKMLAYLEEKNADGVGIETSIKFIGKNVNDVDITHTFGYVGKKIPTEALLQKNNIYCSIYSTFMFTKKAFEIAGGYPTDHGFDTQGFAWRFLSHGLTAYTCPGATYLHRVQFKESYYIREANAGKINYNWRDIFFEHLALFDKDTQDFIRNFDCKDFTKDFFEELKKRDIIFDKNYNEIISSNFPKGEIPTEPRIYISRNSPLGIILRFKSRIKKIIKRHDWLYFIIIYFCALFNRIKNLLIESKMRNEYYQQIEGIKHSKKIVVDLSFGGIGDCLVFSTLPRLLKEKYDIDFYLSKDSLEKIRQRDTFTLCFEPNPYFKGLSDDGDMFKIKTFEHEKSVYTFFTDKEGESLLESLERQFDVKGNGYPELYYKPKMLREYSNVILIDENTISGKKFGWKYKDNIFHNEAIKHCTKEGTIVYVDTKKQDLFSYIDMIYSCKYFVGTFSGGSSISACFKKPFSVIWPYNAINGSNYNFCYKKSKGVYIM